jgi:hypothetical protein
VPFFSLTVWIDIDTGESTLKISQLDQGQGLTDRLVQRRRLAFRVFGCSGRPALRASLTRIALVLALNPADELAISAWASRIFGDVGLAVFHDGARVRNMGVDRNILFSGLRHGFGLPE